MSWLQPSTEDLQYVQQLRQEHPELYTYAQVLAPALRIDSRLLRNLRLRFLPESSIELETGIWLSPLIHTRNVQTAVMHSGITRILCDELLEKNLEQFAAIKIEIIELTRHWIEVDRIEQEIRWSILEGDRQTLKKQLQRILKAITLNEEDYKKRELARWAKGALPILKEIGKTDSEQQWLSQYITASLGITDKTWRKNTELHVLPEALVRAIPKLNKQKVGLRLRPGVLEVLEPEKGLQTIEVSIPLPTIVILRSSEDSDDSDFNMHSFWIGKKIYIHEYIDSIDMQMIDGSQFQIRRLAMEESLVYQCKRCKHVHSIAKSDLILNYEIVNSDPNRGMGTENQYQALEYIECATCDNSITFSFNIWEYPIGIKNWESIDAKGAEVLERLTQEIDLHDEEPWESDYYENKSDKQKNLLMQLKHDVSGKNHEDLKEIFEITRSIISEVMFADNLYIATYNRDTNEISFPLIYKDGSPWIEMRNTKRLLDKGNKGNKGKTEEIILTGQPILHITRKENSLWYADSQRDIIEKSIASWIGVPIKSFQEQVIGVIGMYHPDKENIYSEEDLSFLEQISTILSRKISLPFEEGDSQGYLNILIFGREKTTLNTLKNIIKNTYKFVQLDVIENLEDTLVKLEEEIYDAIITTESRYLKYITQEHKATTILIDKSSMITEYIQNKKIFTVNSQDVSLHLIPLLNAIRNPAKIYFSYGTDEETISILSKLDKLLYQYLPFCMVEKDTIDKNLYRNLNSYIENIPSFDCLIVIIGEKYLHSTYAMSEISRLLKSNDVKYKALPIILDSAREFIFTTEGNINLIDYWKSKDSKIKDTTSFTRQEIIDFLPSLIKHLGDINLPYMNDNRMLIQAIHEHLKSIKIYGEIYKILNNPDFLE